MRLLLDKAPDKTLVKRLWSNYFSVKQEEVITILRQSLQNQRAVVSLNYNIPG